MRTSRLLHFTLLLLLLLSFAAWLVDQRRRSKERGVTILLWHWPFSRSYSLEGDVCQEKYGVPRCLLSDDKSLLAYADLVVFHHHELKVGRSSLPRHVRPRPPKQRWVWLSLEPPVNNGDLSPYNGLFNLTMSYRRDADVFMPYGKTVPLPSRRVGSYAIPKKGGCMASWVVSKYRPEQARAAVYHSLKQSIPIEVYGGWPKKPLADHSLLPTIGRCHFYLAFENSVAVDYISEKLWRNALQAGAVPVVLGPSRANYEAMLPPASFIHVNDFNSTAALASYMQHLASDREAYEAYFKWHQTHDVVTYTDWRERLCNICVMYNQLPARKVYHDLEAWANR